ncbi:MAG TPA: serine/threonine-protein kinase [Kofleriaceae bacterium]
MSAVLGEGGSGIVYDAWWGPRRVALKVLHPQWVGGAAAERVRAQFFAEAKRLAAIAHPSVVKVLAVGELPDGRPYLAMERLDGETLATVLARGPLPLAAALVLFGDLSAAVGALHAQGLVHRDLKPENVFIVDAAGAKHAVLLDFGIAKELAAPASTTTQDGGVRGTPAYMAPERFFGQPAGTATDIYELAVTLYAMLAGRLPWDDVADPESRLSPRPLALPGVPDELDVELRRALSTRAQNRPATATELLAAVRAAADARGADREGEPAETARMRPAGAPGEREGAEHDRAWFAQRQPTTDPTKTPLAWAPTHRPEVTPAPAAPAPRSRRRWVIAAAALAVLAGGGFGAWRLTRPKPAGFVRLPNQLAAEDDPWETPQHAGPAVAIPPPPTDDTDEPHETDAHAAAAIAATPLALGEPVADAVARKELAAAMERLPADDRVLATLLLGELRRSPNLENILEQLYERPEISSISTLVPPCARRVIGAAEWLAVGLQGPQGVGGTVIARGTWSRADVVACFEREDGEPKLVAGAKLYPLAGGAGWADVSDPHVVYFSLRADIPPAAVHAASLGSAGVQLGGTSHARALATALPAGRTFGLAIDGADKDWPEADLPHGSDLVGSMSVEGGGIAFSLAVDAHDATQAAALEARWRDQMSRVFGMLSAAAGTAVVTRDQTIARVDGRLTDLALKMFAK